MNNYLVETDTNLDNMSRIRRAKEDELSIAQFNEDRAFLDYMRDRMSSVEIKLVVELLNKIQNTAEFNHRNKGDN